MRETITRNCFLLSVAVVLLSAPCLAAVGDLEYAKSPPPFGRGLFVSIRSPKKLAQADKLKAIGAIEAFGGEGTVMGVKVAAALIRTKADTREFDTIRVDLTGKGDFKNALKMTLKTDRNTPTYYRTSVVPGQGTLNTGGRDIPVAVTGYYYVLNDRSSMGLTLSAAAEGMCAFGKEIRKVRILDTIGDLKFSGGTASPRDAARLERTGRLTSSALISGISPMFRGDKVQVADGDGRFTDVTMSTGTVLGQPVQVGRKWFVVRAGGMKVSAEPLKAPMGKIAGVGNNCQLHLTGKKHQIIVNGSVGPVSVPTDAYRTLRYVYFRPDKRGKIVPAVKSYATEPFELAEGKTAKIEMGLPMKATIVTKVSTGKVTFSLKRTDAAGHRVLLVMNAAGQRPEAPAIEVVDKTGKVVYTARLEYG